MATPTPDNHVLSSKVAAKGTPPEPTGPAPATEYPKALYHRTESKAGALVAQTVANAEAEKALGSEWVTLAELDIETAPAEKTNGD